MQAFDLKKNRWFGVLMDWKHLPETQEACEVLKEKHPELEYVDIRGGVMEIMWELCKTRDFWMRESEIIPVLQSTNGRLVEETAKDIFKTMLEVGIFEKTEREGRIGKYFVYSSPCLQQIKRKTSQSAINGKKHISQKEKEKQRLQNNAEESPQERHFPDSEAEAKEFQEKTPEPEFIPMDESEAEFEEVEEEPFDLFASESKEKKPKRKTQKPIEEMEGSGLVWVLNDGSKWELPKSILEEFKKNYPAIDVELTLKDCISWNLCEPKRRKTKSGILPHIRCWLSKNQNKAQSGGYQQYNSYGQGRKSYYVARDSGIDFSKVEY